MYKNKLYSIWYNMKSRCFNTADKDYVNYGGRGISVCKEWLDFSTFYIDMKDSYTEGLTIDRKDNNSNYSKDNCRWVTRAVQQRNTRLLKSTNTSGYRGVSFIKRTNRYRAKIKVDGKQIHLGYFDTALEAGIAYNNYVIANDLGYTLNNVITS